MEEEKSAVPRAVLYTLSGGLVTVAFGLLGTASAQAMPLAGDPPGGLGAVKAAAAPKAAAHEVAKSVPVVGGVVKAADAAKKVADSAKKSSDKPKTGSSGDEGKKRAQPEGNDSPAAKNRAREAAKAIPVAGGVLKAADAAKKIVADHTMPRNADPDRKSPPKYDDVAHGKVLPSAPGTFVEDHGGGVTTTRDLKTGNVKINGYELRTSNAPPVSKVIPAIQAEVAKDGPMCTEFDRPDCGTRESLHAWQTSQQLFHACGDDKLGCSEDFEEELVATNISGGSQPPEGGARKDLVMRAVADGAVGAAGGGFRAPAGAVPKGTPGGAKATQGGPEVAPGGAKATQGGPETAPGGAKATPGGAEVAPGGPKATARGSGGPSGTRTVLPEDPATVPTLPRTTPAGGARPSAATTPKAAPKGRSRTAAKQSAATAPDDAAKAAPKNKPKRNSATGPKLNRPADPSQVPKGVQHVKENAHMSPEAKAYNDGAENAREGTAPALFYLKNGILRRAKFDGHHEVSPDPAIDAKVMIDRKRNVYNSKKADNQVRSQAASLRQHGYSGLWEVPNEQVARQARRKMYSDNRWLLHMRVRVVPPTEGK